MKKRATRMAASHRLLERTISAISQADRFSSWPPGIEYEVWHAIATGERGGCHLGFDEQLVEEARWLSRQVSGWIVRDEDRECRFVSLEEWLAIYEANHKRYITDRKSDG